MELLKIVVQSIDDILGKDIVVFDMRKTSPLFDYFVICNGNTKRQVNAITKRIIDDVSDQGYPVKHVEGKETGLWILIDLGSVIVNVFQPEERTHYELEKLWGDIPRIDLDKLMK